MKHGILTQEQYEKIQRLGRDDPQGFVEYAKDVCQDNVPAFNHLFLGHDIVPYTNELWEEIQKYKHNLVQLPRSHGKCCRAGTKVMMADGTWMPIEDVEVGEKVMATDEEGNLNPEPVSAHIGEGEKELIHIETRGGKKVEVTPEHPLLTFDGWTEAGDISPDDYLAIPRTAPEGGENPLTEDELILLAAWIAEGSKTTGSYQFHNQDPDFVSKVGDAADSLGWDMNPVANNDITYGISNGGSQSEGPIPFLREQGLYKCGSAGLHVPDDVFRCDNGRVRTFLRVLFAGDGDINTHSRGIYYTSKSEELARDVHRLLLRFGVTSNVFSKQNRQKEEERTYWYVGIHGASSVAAFAQEVGFFGRDDEVEELREEYGGGRSKSEWDLIPASWREEITTDPKARLREAGFRVDNDYDTTRSKVRDVAEFEDNDVLRQMADSDLAWMKVETIEPVGEHQTYNLETALNHNFVADGIISHNTISVSIGLITHHICYSTVPGSGYQDPRIMLIQESKDSTRQTIGAIQAQLESGGPNNLLHAAFGDIKEKARKWNEAEIQIADSAGVSRDYTLKGYGVNGNMTGAHPRLLIADDPVTKKNAQSEHLRREMWRWWRETVIGMTDPETETFVLGTPYYHDDLYHRLEDTGKYNVLRWPALSRMPESSDFDEIVNEDGVRTGVELTEQGMDLDALWPCPAGKRECTVDEEHFERYGEHRSVKYLLHEKYLEDPVGFRSQYMLDVRGGGETRIKPGMLNFYSYNPDRVGTPSHHNDNPVASFPAKEKITNVVHAWDHAVGKKSAHNNTAFARVLRSEDNKIYFIVEAWKIDFPEAVNRMESYLETEEASGFGRVDKIATEAVGFQEAYNQGLMAQSKQVLADRIEPIKKGADKDQYLVESGLLQAMMNDQVFFDLDDQETIDELLAFTPEGSGYPDDRVDACAMGYHVIKDMVARPAKRLFKLESKAAKHEANRRRGQRGSGRGWSGRNVDF